VPGGIWDKERDKNKEECIHRLLYGEQEKERIDKGIPQAWIRPMSG